MNGDLDRKIEWLIDPKMVQEVNTNEGVQKVIAKALESEGSGGASGSGHASGPTAIVAAGSEKRGNYEVKISGGKGPVGSGSVTFVPYSSLVNVPLEAAVRFCRQLEADGVRFAVCMDPKIFFVDTASIKLLIDQGAIDRNETDWMNFFRGLMSSGVKLAIVERHATTMFAGS